MERYDVVIVGGAAMGASIACHLAMEPGFDGSVLVVERDPGYTRASTALSAASIRSQFSNPVNVQISLFGAAVIRDFPGYLSGGPEGPEAADRRGAAPQVPGLGFHEGGYLYLAATEAQAQRLRENHAVQRACGADVVLWTPAELAQAFPHLRVGDLRLASYGRSGEGWFDNTGLLDGFRARARAGGVHFLHDRVCAVERRGARVSAVTLASGRRIGCGALVNAAGPRAAEVAAMAGLALPVEPRKRTVFVYDCAQSPEGTARVNGGRLPLMIDPSGVYCRPEGRYFMTQCAPEQDGACDPDDFEPGHAEFERQIWPALAARSAAFEAIKVIRSWAGHYAYNRLDQNMILGPHPELPNLYFASGFSGHGLQQAPAVGRGLAELITHGGYRSLDLSALGVARILAEAPFLERNVI
jgi:glycine/D-amino acid oxidase-like deaminating enzyme